MNRLLGIFTAGAMAIAMNGITWAADDRSGTDASRDSYTADLKKCDEIADAARKQACVKKAQKDTNAQNDATQGQTQESTAKTGDDATQGQPVQDGTANAGDDATQGQTQESTANAGDDAAADQTQESTANAGDDATQGQTQESTANAGDDATPGQTQESTADAGDDQQKESTADATGSDDQAGNSDDEQYSAELKKCDALSGADKASCQAAAKEKAGQM